MGRSPRLCLSLCTAPSSWSPLGTRDECPGLCSEPSIWDSHWRLFTRRFAWQINSPKQPSPCQGLSGTVSPSQRGPSWAGALPAPPPFTSNPAQSQGQKPRALPSQPPVPSATDAWPGLAGSQSHWPLAFRRMWAEHWSSSLLALRKPPIPAQTLSASWYDSPMKAGHTAPCNTRSHLSPQWGAGHCLQGGAS